MYWLLRCSITTLLLLILLLHCREKNEKVQIRKVALRLPEERQELPLSISIAIYDKISPPQTLDPPHVSQLTGDNTDLYLSTFFISTILRTNLNATSIVN